MKIFPILASVILLGAAALTSAQVVEKAVPGDPIAIDSGLVAGKILPSGVKAYLGMPFVAAPVRENRWREPQPVKAWKGVYNADRMMPECIQPLRNHNINHYFGEESTSEDCLYLNVWAPATAKPGAKVPVIVFIYGGGFTIGSSANPLYGGENVARNGAIFVNFNYRVGALGFMAHPELTEESPHHASGNYGLLDQVAALQWIQRNIAKFGGDPAKVIISGQSAGAGSVSLLEASSLAKGLFRGIVAMSGSAWSNGGQAPPLQQAEKVGLQIQDALKVKSLAELRQISADHILALQEDCQLGCSGSIRIGAAVVDSYFLPESPAQIFAEHKQNDVPVIASFTHDESSNELRAAKNLVEYIAAAKKLYGDQADEFLKLYPASTDAEAREMGRTAARETLIEKGQRNWAIEQAKFGTAPVYLDMYSRVHPYIPGVVIADQDTATIGAYHTSDVPYWFGTQDALNIIRPTRNWTPYDRELSNKMIEALIAFAATGDPNTHAVNWPKWTPTDEKLVEFGDTINVQPMNTARLDFVAKHGVVGGAPPAPHAARD
jgi:para-nitrobenzyl esterase